MTRTMRYSVIFMLLFFGYCVPLIIATDSYEKRGRAYVESASAPAGSRPVMLYKALQVCGQDDWGCELGNAYYLHAL